MIEKKIDLDFLKKMCGEGDLETRDLEKVVVQYNLIIEDKKVGAAAILKIGNKYIHDCLVVKKEYQGKGFGKKLVEKTLEWCKNKEIKKVYVMTKKPDFYEKLGFYKIEMSELPEEYTGPCKECDMYKQSCFPVAMEIKL